MLPARDLLHMPFRRSLENAGWTITDDPLSLKYDDVDLFIDLAAVHVDPQETQSAAFEVKSFVGRSVIADLRDALGQYLLYRTVLRATGIPHTLYLAVAAQEYADLFEHGLGQLLCAEYNLLVVRFDPDREEITQWPT